MELDEPDGMQGIAAMRTSTSLLEQTREFESAGNWTDAMTCYEQVGTVCCNQSSSASLCFGFLISGAAE